MINDFQQILKSIYIAFDRISHFDSLSIIKIAKTFIFCYNYFMKKIIFLTLSGIILLFSCSSQVNGVLKEGGAADLSMKASLAPSMTNIIRSLKMVMDSTGLGNSDTDQILDGPTMSRSMETSPGVDSVKLVNTGPAALEGTIIISKVEDFLSSGEGDSFITYSERRVDGKPAGSVLVNIDRKTIPVLLQYMSAEATDYLITLMAPAILDEDIPRTEYLFLISTIYGRALADEMRTAEIKLEIELPGPVKFISGGVSEGTKAVFNIPVLDLLVMEKPLSWEINW